jgi:hypothetical protein
MRPGPAALLLFLLFVACALWQFLIVDACFVPYILNGAKACARSGSPESPTWSALVLLALNAAVTFMVVRASDSHSWLAVLGNATIAIVLVRATWLIGRDLFPINAISARDLQIVLTCVAGAAMGLSAANAFPNRRNR